MIISKKPFFDLKSILIFGPLKILNLKGVAHVFRLSDISPDHGYCTKVRIPQVRRSISWQLPDKKFYGNSLNAVKPQIWTAISTYVLVAILKKQIELDESLYPILQILSVIMFHQEPTLQLLTDNSYAFGGIYTDNQLLLPGL